MTHAFPQKRWVPEVHENLTQWISNGPGLACFDFDNTLIHNDFGEKIMEAIVTDGMVHLPRDLSPYFRDQDFWKDHTKHRIEAKAPLLWEEYSYQLKEFGIEEGYRWTSFLFQGWTKSEFHSFCQKLWQTVQTPKSDSAVFPQPEMLDLLTHLRNKNWETYIVTASPEEGIAAIADHFSIPASKVIGMRLETNNAGRSLEKIIEPYTYGEGKVKAILSRIGKLPDLAFGDSFNDYPMLCAAKLGAVAFDKGNPEFVAACKKENILIQPFFSHS